jgi:hypothetical protein
MVKYVKFGVAWMKQTKKDGREFLSASVKTKDSDAYVNKDFKTGKVSKTKLFLQVDDQEPVQVESFSVFPTNVDLEKYPTAPNFELTLTVEE